MFPNFGSFTCDVWNHLLQKLLLGCFCCCVWAEDWTLLWILFMENLVFWETSIVSDPTWPKFSDKLLGGKVCSISLDPVEFTWDLSISLMRREQERCTLQKHRIGVRLFEGSFQFLLQHIKDFLFGELESWKQAKILQDPHTEHLRSFGCKWASQRRSCWNAPPIPGDTATSTLLVGVAHHRVFVGISPLLPLSLSFLFNPVSVIIAIFHSKSQGLYQDLADFV